MAKIARDPVVGLIPLDEPNAEGDEFEIFREEDFAGFNRNNLTQHEAALLRDHRADIKRHFQNLAPAIMDRAPEELVGVGSEVVDDYERDADGRKDYFDRVTEGMMYLGITQEKLAVAPFDGATDICHPLLMDSAIKFWARTMGAMWPAEGPVKTQILGKTDPDRDAQAERVKNFMNFLYSKEMDGAYENFASFIMQLPFFGTMFRLPEWDELRGMVTVHSLLPEEVIVPYRTTDLQTAPRYTYMRRRWPAELRRMFAMDELWEPPQGIPTPMDDMDDSYADNIIKEARDDIEGSEDSRIDSGDFQHVLLYQARYMNFPSVEERVFENEEDTLPLPYMIVVEQETQRVVGIFRDWKEEDPAMLRWVRLVAYRLLPGIGTFYGLGFFHLAGDFARSATGSVRALLDAAYLANLRGGYRRAGMKFQDNSPEFVPGQWKEVTYDPSLPLRESFFSPDYPEPSAVLMELLKYVEQEGRSVLSTLDAKLEDASNTGPVGTTLALLDQMMQVPTGIHSLLHKSFTKELSGIADLIRIHLPPEYPYKVPGGDQTVMIKDFDDRIDVEPVSDPNINTLPQRMAAGQAAREMAVEQPGMFDLYEVYRMNVAALPAVSEEVLMKPKEQYEEDQKNQQDPKVQLEMMKMQADMQKAQMQMQVEMQKIQLALQQLQLKSATDSAQLQLEDDKARADALLRQEEIKLKATEVAVDARDKVAAAVDRRKALTNPKPSANKRST